MTKSSSSATMVWPSPPRPWLWVATLTTGATCLPWWTPSRAGSVTAKTVSSSLNEEHESEHTCSPSFNIYFLLCFPLFSSPNRSSFLFPSFFHPFFNRNSLTMCNSGQSFTSTSKLFLAQFLKIHFPPMPIVCLSLSLRPRSMFPVQ